jgi:hypothetical protein
MLRFANTELLESVAPQAIATVGAVIGGGDTPPARIVLFSDGKETMPSNPNNPKGAFTARRAPPTTPDGEHRRRAVGLSDTVKPSGNGQSVPIGWWYPGGGLTASDTFLSEVWWVEGTAAGDGEVSEADGVKHDEDILRRDARPATQVAHGRFEECLLRRYRPLLAGDHPYHDEPIGSGPAHESAVIDEFVALALMDHLKSVLGGNAELGHQCVVYCIGDIPELFGRSAAQQSDVDDRHRLLPSGLVPVWD